MAHVSPLVETEPWLLPPTAPCCMGWETRLTLPAAGQAMRYTVRSDGEEVAEPHCFLPQPKPEAWGHKTQCLQGPGRSSKWVQWVQDYQILLLIRHRYEELPLFCKRTQPGKRDDTGQWMVWLPVGKTAGSGGNSEKLVITWTSQMGSDYYLASENYGHMGMWAQCYKSFWFFQTKPEMQTFLWHLVSLNVSKADKQRKTDSFFFNLPDRQNKSIN